MTVEDEVRAVSAAFDAALIRNDAPEVDGAWRCALSHQTSADTTSGADGEP